MHKVSAPPAKSVQLSRPTKPARAATATVATSCGDFEIELDTARAPKTTSSFAYLARHGVYDDALPPHRSRIHHPGRRPTGTGTGGPGSVDELPPRSLSYTRGIVAMAKSPVERRGAQEPVFVVTEADAGLTPTTRCSGG
jgi:cyclophilin family peptidyl-prolyl cis-trans isomerase